MAADDYNIISKHGKTTTGNAVSPNSIKRPKERVPAKPDMPKVNKGFICQLCSGYLIDATAIIECQHTFCKSCIIKYVATNSSYCPVCDVQLNKEKPQLSLRSDVILQRLVYKSVPGLLVSEIRRRREFSIKKGIDSTEAGVLASNSIVEEIETAADHPTVLALEDVVSLSIEYYRSDAADKDASTGAVSSTKAADTNGKQSAAATDIKAGMGAASTTTQNQQQQKSNVKSNSSCDTGSAISTNKITTIDVNTGDENSNEQANDRRYLQCPAAVSVGLLKKFIRMKYGLSDDYRVDLLYNGNRDNILENCLTLVDVAFTFEWKNKEEPMNIHYRIFERPVKSVTVYSGMKRPAPSVMDEPPDDDTASGPHNRSSMFSSSSAPSSKLPRLADNTSASGNQGSVRNSNTSGKSTTTSTSSLSSSTSTSVSAAASLPAKSAGNSSSSSAASTSTTAPLPTTATIKVEKEEVEDDEDIDDDDEDDEEEDYELVERKEHMKGVKSARRLHNSIKESMKRSVAIASSNLSSSLRVNQTSASSRAHSTDTKGIAETERESARNENSLSSGSSKRLSGGKKRGKSHDNQTEKAKGKVDSLRLRVSSTSSTSSEHNTSDGSDNHPHHHQPLKLSISTTGGTPAVVSSSAAVEKKEPLKLSLGTVLASKTGSKSPERKHHKHKHHHKLRHRDKQGKGVTPSATVTNNNQKPLKLSFTLSPPSVATSQNSSGDQSQKGKASQDAREAKEQQSQQQQQSAQNISSSGKGKPVAGMQNFNNSARTSASAHGHLNNISKSISVSVSANNNSGNNTTISSAASANNTVNSKGNQQQQYGNKTLSPAELIPKNTGIEIQPTTIPVSSSSHISQQQHSTSMQNASSASGNNNSHKHSHPLLPDSVHVPKSVTLIPVNPNQMPNLGGVNTGSGKGKLNNALSASGNASSLQDKGSSGSQGNQNRINTHTFTHPITNKSLHQITVTEVPPPQQKSGNAVVVTTTNTTHSSISVSTSNPIEKVIANAANKPQFNGPGSMEITKIYCGANSSKENPAKKLKDRKGLDISITGTGYNVNVSKPSHNKLEEALRQKVNMGIGGGSGSISVTPAAPPPTNNMTLLGQGMSGNNNMNTGNKGKSVSSAAASLLSGKMPPGITIGPATVPPNSSSGSGNNNNNNNMGNTGMASNSNANNSANVGSSIMKGLGFTLPPHLTAHPHIPNNNNAKTTHPNTNSNNSQAKSDKMNAATNAMNTNNSRLLNKDSISIIGKGSGVAGGGGQQQPPPVEITISASGGPGGKSQASITNNRGAISIVNKSKMSNDPLASIFDITQGLQRKSPSPIINAANNPATTTKDMKGMQQAPSGANNSSQQQANKNTNMANKRPFDLAALSGGTTQGNSNASNSKKLTKESPEQKRSRSASASSEPDKNKQQQGGNSSSSTGEIPLDLSGRSTRTTPPITIPHPRESSKSPAEKPRKSPERAEKPEIRITPSTPTSNANLQGTLASNSLSCKMNVTNQKNTIVPPPPPAAATQDHFKGQSKSISVSKLSPNQTSKIGSIVDSLAQKQAQAQQQQQLQNLKNSQSQQQQQHHQQQQQKHQHHHHSSPASNANTSAKMASPNSNITHSASSGNNSGGGSAMKSSPGGNNSNTAKVSPSSSGLTSPITASPVIPMTSPSPPGGAGAVEAHLRNLWTLSDANRQGKLNHMNEFLAAASLFSSSGHPHHMSSGAAAAQQLAAAAAAAVAASGSPSGAPGSGTGAGGAANAFNSNLFAATFGHHLAALGAANKLPQGMFDPHFMAATLNAQNMNAAHAAGMRLHHPFAGSLSPPLNVPNAFFPPHGAPGSAPPLQQQSPSSLVPGGGAGGMKIPTSKPSASPGGNAAAPPGKSPNSMQFSPLFSHSVPVSSPKSPNLVQSPSVQAKSPVTGSMHSTASSSMLGNASVNNHGSGSSNAIAQQHNQKHGNSHSHGSVSGKSAHHHHQHESSTHSSSHAASGAGSKSSKINGTVSTTAMPVFPPGIHNPLLPSRSSSSSSNSGNSFQSALSSASAAKAALNKSFNALNKNLGSASAANAASNPAKGAIPNSMKISNFLPSKPKDPQSDANAEATITSGYGIMPPLQAKPNFSLSPTRAVQNTLIPPSVNIPKHSPHAFNAKESNAPVSPVKGAGGSNQNKPSSMTCASLLLPDTLYSKPFLPTSHHLLNSLSPTKGDHHLQQPQQHHGLSSASRLTARAPSSDSVLLSPTTNKTTSPGAPTSNKSHNSKDGFSRASTDMAHHRSNKSPTKEIITSKKEIGSIPTGPTATAGSLLGNRNFSSSSPNTLARPIPTIPAFMNRTSAAPSSNPCPQSLHSLPLAKDGLQQKSISPVKMSNEQQPTSHLPPPVFFPFPGVSVPVQVKLQDEDDAALPAVTPSITNTTSLSVASSLSSASTHGISLKPEVDKLLAAKEEKAEERRKRACSPQLALSNAGSHQFTSLNEPGNKVKSGLTSATVSKKGDGNSVGELPAAPPAKVQKIEMHADAPSSVKNENASKTALIPENKSSSSESSNVFEKGAVVKSESELLEQRESKVGEGEKMETASNEEKGDAVVVAGADPSKVLLSSTPANVACTTTAAALLSTAESSCKTEAETPSPVKAVEVSLEKLSDPAFQPPPPPALAASQSEKQTEEEQAEKSENRDKSENLSMVTAQEEKSTVQIKQDADIPAKSDETSIQFTEKREESKSSVEIPEGAKSGQPANNNATKEEGKIIMTDNDNNDNEDEEVDVEMVKDADESEVLGQTETPQAHNEEMEIAAEVADTNEKQTNDTMAVDDETEKQKDASVVEERVMLTKAGDDEDADVDVVDVGVDEPMEINTTELNDDDTEEGLCIDVEEGSSGNLVISSNPEDNERVEMEVEAENDEVDPACELIESLPADNNSEPTTCLNDKDDDVNNVVDDKEDRTNKSGEKKDVEEEEKKEEGKAAEDPVEISLDVIEQPKVEETDTVSQVEMVASPAQVQQQSTSGEEKVEEKERKEMQEESTFLVAVNEASNFSQDDSECGDLVIDLGPSAGENEIVANDDDDDDDAEAGAEDENNEKETEALLNQEESNQSVVVQLEIKESSQEATTFAVVSMEYSSPFSQEACDPAVVAIEEEDEAATLSIINSESNEADQGEEVLVQISPESEEKQEDDAKVGAVSSQMMMMMTPMESGESTTAEQQVAHVFKSLNQDSFPNQITINPASIEVNGVIKSDVEEKREEESSENEKLSAEDVAECPAEETGENVHDSLAPSESGEEERGTLAEPSGNVGAPEEDNKIVSEDFTTEAAKELSTVSSVMVESNAQLEEASPVTDTTAEYNKNAEHNEQSSAVVDDKKIEEEQQLEEVHCEEEKGEQELSQIDMLPEPDSIPSIIEHPPVCSDEEQRETAPATVETVNTIGDGSETAPVLFLEQDNNVENSEHISSVDDSSTITILVQQELIQSLVPENNADAEENAVVPMEVDDFEMSEQVDNCDEMIVDTEEQQQQEEMPATENIALTVFEIDDDSMQMETDNSAVSQLQAQISSLSNEAESATTPDVVVLVEDETSVPAEDAVSVSASPVGQVAVISATITATSASVSSEDAENVGLTPTTSTSSVAIKLDISANDTTGDDDDGAGENAAASLLPSSMNNAVATNPSSSSLIIPSSDSSSGPSSSSATSSSSPVDVPATTTTGLAGIGSKSLETFGKVAAGLLASATSTINNNNNNTSLAPSSCDAISIATTNANA